MPFFYNEAKNGSKFATVATIDPSTLNARFEFNELRFIADDDFYHIYAHATKLTDTLKIGEKDWKFTPQLIYFKAARRNYQRYDSKEKKKVDAEQSRIEKLVCYLLAQCEPEKTYKGYIILQDALGIDLILNRKDQSGKEIPEALLPTLLASYGQLDETEPNLITDEDVKIPTANKSWNNSKQSEIDILNDRLMWVASQVKASYPNYEIKSVGDLVPGAIAERDAENSQGIYAIVEFSLLFLK